MKIGLVTPYYYPTYGGVQEHVFNYYKILKKRGYKVKIIAPFYKNLPCSDFSYSDVIRIGKAYPLRIYETCVWITFPFGLSYQVRKILKSYNFDFLHFHEPLMPFLNLIILRNSKSINIGTFHAYLEHNIFYLIFKNFLKKYIKKLNKIICVSEATERFLKKYFQVKTIIISNGIDLEKFKPNLKKIEKYNDNKLNILFVGRNEKRKGLVYLLKAFEIIKQKINNIRLIVVGGGFIEKLRKENLENYKKQGVFFEGKVKNNLAHYYCTASVFCSPAIGGESFGIVLLEAMACGVPIVASNIEGYNKVIKNGETGLLVSPKNPLKIASAIIKILENKNLKDKFIYNALKKVKEYSWEKVTEKILKCYNNKEV